MLTQIRESQIKKRHLRIRKRMFGMAERPRLSVHRSHLNLYAQVIDDNAEKTLLSASTLNLKEKSSAKGGSAANSGGKKQLGNLDGAKKFGVFLADALKKKNIKQIVFDRGGFPYHGRIKAFAEALRENGIQF